MKIAIWGAGAVGLGLATALARPENALRLLVRNEGMAASIEAKGIRRTGFFGETHVPPEQLDIIRSARLFADDPPDWLLICTKAFSAPGVARELKGFASQLTSVTRIMLCQNGWGNESPFLEFWPADRLYHARVITGFHRRENSLVEITAHASAIALGSLFGGSIDVLAALSDRLSQGGIPAETATDMRAVLWAKMLYNCALNPLSALAGRRYGELTSDPTTKALLEEVVREIFSVLDAAHIELAWPGAAAYLETFYDELIPATAAHESSMLQDLRAGHRTEIEALCGAVERLGTEHNVETPVTSALATLVRAAESGGRDRSYLSG